MALVGLGGCDQGGKDADGAKADAALASKLFPDNFKGVCSGASVSVAAAYDAAASGHKALYFRSYKDDLTDSSTSLPGDWTVQWSPDSDALRAIDLVACAKRTAAKEAKICDGYKDDGKPTENKVRWHTATYEVSVREAKTGKVLDTTTLEATGTDCPMFMNFDGNADTVDGYDSLSDSAIADFLKPHVKL
ncbi:MAG: hypothetical protein ACREBO_03475 [Novosphingobium sp.]